MDIESFEDVWHFVKSWYDYSALVIGDNGAIHLPPWHGSLWDRLRADLLHLLLMERGLGG